MSVCVYRHTFLPQRTGQTFASTLPIGCHQRTGGSGDVEEQVYWKCPEGENRKLLQGPGYGHIGCLGSSEVGGPRMEEVGEDEVWGLCGVGYQITFQTTQGTIRPGVERKSQI